MTKLILENPGMHQNAKPKLFEFARQHRENPTHAEAILWEVLKGKKLGGHKFRRQHTVGAYILDFYCHATKLSIEIDGGYHSTMERMEYDKCRTKDLKSLGIEELRFTNEQVVNDLGRVLESILKNLNLETSLDINMPVSPPPTPKGESRSISGYSVEKLSIMHSPK